MQTGIKNAIKVFNQSAKEVEAYKDFLKKRNSHRLVKNQNEFFNLPITSKKNYVSKYSIYDRFPGKKMPPIIYASSGSSGTPTFWFNNEEHELLSGLEHILLYSNALKIKKSEPTLVIVCFAMGLWIAGPHTVTSNRIVSKKGYNLSIAAPGYLISDILNVLESLGRHYKNIIFFGHPPRLMDIMIMAKKEKLLKKYHNIKLIASGDKVTETWRDNISKLLNLKDRYHSVIGLYGSTDAGAMAFETPLSIFLKREAIKNPYLYEKLFGESIVEPALYQYNPNNIFFESINEQIIITSNTAAPLVRYNILDLGHIISYEEVKKVLKKLRIINQAKSHELQKWNRPFVVVKGRADVATRFYALAIYPEHLHAALNNNKIKKYLTGNYFIFTESINEDRLQQLHIYLELSPKKSKSKKLSEKIQLTIAQSLMDMSLEYRKLHSLLDQNALPIIHLSKYNEKSFYPVKKRGMLYINGKKPKLIY